MSYDLLPLDEFRLRQALRKSSDNQNLINNILASFREEVGLDEAWVPANSGDPYYPTLLYSNSGQLLFIKTKL